MCFYIQPLGNSLAFSLSFPGHSLEHVLPSVFPCFENLRGSFSFIFIIHSFVHRSRLLSTACDSSIDFSFTPSDPPCSQTCVTLGPVYTFPSGYKSRHVLCKATTLSKSPKPFDSHTSSQHNSTRFPTSSFIQIIQIPTVYAFV